MSGVISVNGFDNSGVLLFQSMYPWGCDLCGCGLGDLLESLASGWNKWGPLWGRNPTLSTPWLELVYQGADQAWPELWEAAPGREAHPVTQRTSASRKK